jgi:hypothetical protein
MTTTAPAAAWSDPRLDHDPNIRRAKLAARQDISARISDAAQTLLGLRAWASPEQATLLISTIEAVAWEHSQMIEAQDAHDAAEMRQRLARDYGRSGFAGLRG